MIEAAMRNRYLVIIWIIFGLACSQARDIKNPPNILLILADDMGYSDIGCFGGEIRTPNIDRLADSGIRFTQFYNAARCCPTRASLMTGLYPHECGIGHMTHRNNGPGYLGYLNDSCVTIPEVLSQAGYFTAMTGKWHAGAVRVSWPENRGFQRFYGIHHWVDSYFNVLEDCEIFENGEIVIPATGDPAAFDPDREGEWYTTDVFTGKAIEFMQEALSLDQPFFQYVAYNAPHWPLEAHDADIEHYLDAYTGGYEELRSLKYQRMIEMELISEDWDLPEQVTPDWQDLNEAARLDTRFRRAVYAAQIEIMDRNIGRMIDFLKSQKVLDNTLILFLSDNGCSAEPESDWFGYQWGKNTRWNYPEWRRNSGRGGASQGKAWAIASNAPFRKYKKFAYEGGISTPLIAHWPAGIRNPGSLDNKPGHLVDIMATCLDAADIDYPSKRNGQPIKPLRGISLMENFAGLPGHQHGALFWEHEGHAALRKGKWKIVTDKPLDDSAWELYDMEKDRTETRNLSQEFPDILSELITSWTKIAFETKVMPFPDKSLSVPNPVDK